MRYLIKESHDPGERNHYFDSAAMPIIGHAVGYGSRTYEVMDIEIANPLAGGTTQDVRVLVRRVT